MMCDGTRIALLLDMEMCKRRKQLACHNVVAYAGRCDSAIGYPESPPEALRTPTISKAVTSCHIIKGLDLLQTFSIEQRTNYY